MSEIKSIADVITSLDGFVTNCALSQNRAGYFAALYKRMTIAVADGIKTGHFQDGPRMEALDVVFALRYLDAIGAHQKRGAMTSSWKFAFDGCSNESLTVLQHLLLGINTHINLDLAIAAATIAPGEKIHALQTDFNRINDLIASLVDDIQQCLEKVWFPMRFFRDGVNRQGHAVMNFSIEAARKTAWANAVALAGMNTAGQATHIQAMDEMVRCVGERIMHPGAWPAFLIKLVRLTEYENPAETIRLIDTTVV